MAAASRLPFSPSYRWYARTTWSSRRERSRSRRSHRPVPVTALPSRPITAIVTLSTERSQHGGHRRAVFPVRDDQVLAELAADPHAAAAGGGGAGRVQAHAGIGEPRSGVGDLAPQRAVHLPQAQPALPAA